jgi:hypothetical protein
MRRNSFLIGAVVALATYAALAAFVRRPWGWYRGWRYHHCYYDDRYRDRDWDRGRRPERPAQPLSDSTTLR